MQVPDDAEIVLSVGGSISLWDVILGKWLEILNNRRLPILVHADTSKHDALIRKIQDNTLDLAFTFEIATTSELEIERIARIPLILVSSRPGQSTEEAMEQNYISVDWGISVATELANHFPDARPPRFRVGIGSIAKNLILNCGGAAYLAEPSVRKSLLKKKLHMVEGSPIIERRAYALYRTDSERVDMLKQVLEYFHEMKQITVPDLSVYR